MRCLLILLFLMVLACVHLPPASKAQGNSPVMERPLSLAPEAAQLAEQLGVMGKLTELNQLRQRTSAEQLDTVKQLAVKQSITQSVLVAMLQVRGATALVSHDISTANHLRTILENRRDREVQLNSIANFVSGGVSELVGGALQLAPPFQIQQAGNINEMTGGGLQTLLSTLALRQQRGHKARVLQSPNMLAPLFKLETDVDSKYPAIVWTYLNSTVPGESEPRANLLIKRWIAAGWLPTPLRPGYIAAVTGSGAKTEPINIGVLENREAMLSDLSRAMSQIEKDLLDIVLYINISD